MVNHNINVNSYYYLFILFIIFGGLRKLTFAVLLKWKTAILSLVTGMSTIIRITAPIAIFSYSIVVRIPKRSVPIPLNKRKCLVYSRDAERLLSATLLI